MQLAETKRYWVLNEAWNYTAALPNDLAIGDSYIVNAFSPPPAGVGDNQFIGNQILEPLFVLDVSIVVNWWLAATYYAPRIPTYRVSVALIAINNQFDISTPRGLTGSEMNGLFLRQPTIDLRWMMNKQNMVVIKRKTVMLSPKNISFAAGTGTNPGASHEIRRIKVKKQFRGKKTYEQSVSSLGVVTNTNTLRGWNFYWMVTSQWSTPNTVVAAVNPLVITSDRYMYFKDL